MSQSEPILITGAGGMLAQAIARALTARGLNSILLSRSDCDITDSGSVERAFQTHRPKVLLNCAAYTKVDLAEEQIEAAVAVNGEGSGLLAEAAKKFRTTLVHFSTDFVFDGSSSRPYRTTDPTNPLSVYGRSKLLGEQRVAEVNPPGWLTIRTAWLYGPDGPCFPNTMLSLARKGVPLKVVSDQIGAPTLTTDLAEATLELLDRGAAGLWHLTNAGQTNWFDFTCAIMEEFDVQPIELSPTTAAEWKQARPKSAIRPAYSVLETEPFTKTVGRQMRPWREALHLYRTEVAVRRGSAIL